MLIHLNTVSQARECCVRPEHGLDDCLQRDLQVQFVSAGKLHIDGFVSGDDVAGVVDALDPDGVLVHDVCAV